MPDTPRRIEGGCHCGNIGFDFDWPEAGGTIPVRACGCNFCRKHGGVYTSHPDGAISVRVRDPGAVNRYRFGHRTADFHVWRACGAVPVVTSEIDGHTYAVVNVNCFDGVDPSELDRAATDFEGEGSDDRLARRRRNWTARVRLA